MAFFWLIKRIIFNFFPKQTFYILGRRWAILGQGNSGTGRAIPDKNIFTKLNKEFRQKIVGILLADTSYMDLLLGNFGRFFGKG